MESLKNSTPTELGRELKKDHRRDKELDDHQNDIFMQNVLGKIEERRKSLKKISPIYTQKYVAEKAGISFSTYKNYLNGYNTGFSLRMLKNIADALGRKPQEFFD